MSEHHGDRTTGPRDPAWHERRRTAREALKSVRNNAISADSRDAFAAFVADQSSTWSPEDLTAWLADRPTLESFLDGWTTARRLGMTWEELRDYLARG